MSELCNFSYRHYHRKEDYRILWFVLNKPINVTVLIGLPGSGKTTKLQEFVKSTCDNYVILSRDLIRVELGYCTEDKVTEVFNQRFKEALDCNLEIYIDNINLRRCDRDDYKKLAGKHNIRWNYVYIQPSNLNLNYERRPKISKIVFDEMIQKFDWPTPDEYDDLAIIDYE